VSRKPQKLTLSPTKITIFLACAAKYRWTYVDPIGRNYMRSKSYFSFGTTLHNVLQRFHDSGDTGVTTTAEVLAAYEESWIDAGYTSAEEMAEAYGEGRQILERHVEETRQRRPEAKTLFVEKQLRKDMGDFVLLGRIDRVDEYEDGTLEIVDYKSGREEVTAEEVADDVAMNCYQILMLHRYPGRPIRARIFAIRTGSSACASMTDEQADEFEFVLHEIAREISGKEQFYDEVPVFRALCTRCDFLPLCRKHEEFAEPSALEA
jgi:putative RecB family exonuclease